MTFDATTVRDLERASAYQFVSLLFLPPGPDLRAQLDRLAPVLPINLRDQARALIAGMGSREDVEHAYHALLGASGPVRDCESDYDPNQLGGKGGLLADVAAFYRAFSFDSEPLQLVHDHVAVELAFLSYLALKTAYARQAGLASELEVCEQAAAGFERDHLGRFAPIMLGQLAELAGDDFHGRVAGLAASALDEVTAIGH